MEGGGGAIHGQGWIRVEGVIRMARLRREPGHRWHRQSRDHRTTVQTGTQRHRGEDLPRDPSAQGRAQVAHGVLQENFLGHNRRTCRKLRNLIEKNKSRRPGATKRLVAQRDEPACTRAGPAVLVPFKRVLSLSSRTCITSCGLDSRGRQRVRHTYVTTIGRLGSSAIATNSIVLMLFIAWDAAGNGTNHELPSYQRLSGREGRQLCETTQVCQIECAVLAVNHILQQERHKNGLIEPSPSFGGMHTQQHLCNS